MSDDTVALRQTLVALDAKHVELFRTYREKITHEDTLVNQRTTRLVTLQAFLFTSVAILTRQDINPDAYQQIFIAILFAGLGSCAATAVTVLTAKRAIADTAARWQKVAVTLGLEEVFPVAAGGGKQDHFTWLGRCAAYAAPFVLSVAWVMIAGAVSFHGKP